MPANALTGIGGAVDGVGGVTQWGIDLKSDLPDYGSSATAGGTKRNIGNKDWSGSFNAMSYATAFFPGKTPTFTGDTADGGGVSGPVFVESLEIKMDIEGAKPVEYSVKFSGDGALTLSGTASDSTDAAEATSVGGKVLLGGVELTCVRTATVTITNKPNEYVSSCTSGWKRRAKGRLDATASITRHLQATSEIQIPNTVTTLELQDGDGNTICELEYVIVGESTGIEVDTQDGKVVGETINLSWSSHDLDGTKGSITIGAAAEWPPT